jgi:hypothetical protein
MLAPSLSSVLRIEGRTSRQINRQIDVAVVLAHGHLPLDLAGLSILRLQLRRHRPDARVQIEQAEGAVQLQLGVDEGGAFSLNPRVMR